MIHSQMFMFLTWPIQTKPRKNQKRHQNQPCVLPENQSWVSLTPRYQFHHGNRLVSPWFYHPWKSGAISGSSAPKSCCVTWCWPRKRRSTWRIRRGKKTWWLNHGWTNKNAAIDTFMDNSKGDVFLEPQVGLVLLSTVNICEPKNMDPILELTIWQML